MIKTVVFEERAGLLRAFLDGAGWKYTSSPVHQRMVEFTIISTGEPIPHDAMAEAHYWITQSNLLHTVIVPGILQIAQEFTYGWKESQTG